MIYKGTCSIKTSGWKRWPAIFDKLSDTVAAAENLKPCIEELVKDCPQDISRRLLTEADNLRRVAAFLEQQAQKAKEKNSADF